MGCGPAEVTAESAKVSVLPPATMIPNSASSQVLADQAASMVRPVRVTLTGPQVTTASWSTLPVCALMAVSHAVEELAGVAGSVTVTLPTARTDTDLVICNCSG